MRAVIALEVFVCLTGPCFASEAASTSEVRPQTDWVTVHDAGVEAYRNGAYAEALASFEQCWPNASTPARRATVATDIGATLHALERETEARSWFERGFGMWRAISGRPDGIARAALGLADVERGMGDFGAAEQTLRTAIDAKPPAEREAALRNRLADMMREQGRNEEARRQLASALIAAGNSPGEQIDSLLGMAELDRETMRWDEGVAAWNKVLDLARRQNDINSEALALRGLGLTHLNRGEVSQAEPLVRRSLWLFEHNKDTPPQQLANALQCSASIDYERKKYALAEDELMRGLGLLKQSIGEEHPHSARLMEELSEVLAKEKRYPDARAYADRAYSIMIRRFGEESFSAAEARGTIGMVKQASHDLTGAAEDYEAAIRTFRRTEAPDSQGLVILMDRYALVLNALHRKREARQLEAEIRSFRAP